MAAGVDVAAVTGAWPGGKACPDSSGAWRIQHAVVWPHCNKVPIAQLKLCLLFPRNSCLSNTEVLGKYVPVEETRWASLKRGVAAQNWGKDPSLLGHFPGWPPVGRAHSAGKHSRNV